MNSSLPEKEKLLSMLTEIYDQLEELELVLEASFSDHRIRMNNEELGKLKAPEQRLSKIEKQLEMGYPGYKEEESDTKLTPRSLKLEMGF